MYMGTEPQPREITEFDLRLQQVLSEATREFREALTAEQLEGGFIQRYIGGEGEVIPVPTIGFRLRSKAPRMVRGSLVHEDWVIHVPDHEDGSKFLSEIWIEKILRVSGKTHLVIQAIDHTGSALIYDDEGKIEVDELSVPLDDTGQLSLEEELVRGLQTELEALKGIAQSLKNDFTVVQFYS